MAQKLASGRAGAHDSGGMAWHGRGTMRCHGAMGGWGMVSHAAWPKRGWPKGQSGSRGHSASLVCFTNIFKENVKLQKGLGRIIYSEKDGLIYLTEKMKEELIHHSNYNQIVSEGRNCIIFLSLYQGFKQAN